MHYFTLTTNQGFGHEETGERKRGKVVIFNKCRRNLKKCLNMALVILGYSFVGDFVNGIILGNEPICINAIVTNCDSGRLITNGIIVSADAVEP